MGNAVLILLPLGGAKPIRKNSPVMSAVTRQFFFRCGARPVFATFYPARGAFRTIELGICGGIGNRLQHLPGGTTIGKHRRKFAPAGMIFKYPFAGIYPRGIWRILYRKTVYGCRIDPSGTRMEPLGTVVLPFPAKNVLLVHLQAIFKRGPMCECHAIHLSQNRKRNSNPAIKIAFIRMSYMGSIPSSDSSFRGSILQ